MKNLKSIQALLFTAGILMLTDASAQTTQPEADKLIPELISTIAEEANIFTHPMLDNYKTMYIQAAGRLSKASRHHLTSSITPSSLAVRNPGPVVRPNDDEVKHCEDRDNDDKRKACPRRKRIVAFLQCVTDDGEGHFTAVFGYENRNDRTIHLSPAIANKNSVRPGKRFRGQPVLFRPGRIEDAARITFSHKEHLIWKLDGKQASAKASSPRCSNLPPSGSHKTVWVLPRPQALEGTSEVSEPTMTSIDLVEGARDPEGETVMLHSVPSVTAAGGDVFVTLKDEGEDEEGHLEPIVDYAPPAGFEGIDSFTYALSDESGAIGTVQYSIIVAATVGEAFRLFSDAHPDREDFGKLTQFFEFSESSNPLFVQKSGSTSGGSCERRCTARYFRQCVETTTTTTNPDGTTKTETQRTCGEWDLVSLTCRPFMCGGGGSPVPPIGPRPPPPGTSPPPPPVCDFACQCMACRDKRSACLATADGKFRRCLEAAQREGFRRCQNPGTPLFSCTEKLVNGSTASFNVNIVIGEIGGGSYSPEPLRAVCDRSRDIETMKCQMDSPCELTVCSSQ